MTLTTVVFDIGGVLVDWQPHLAWTDEMTPADARAFMDRIGFNQINLACDAGASFTAAAREIAVTEDAARLAQYVARYPQTVPRKVPGTWDVLYELKAAGVSLHAITNWSAETWPQGLKAHPELGEVFETTIVSGQEGIVKPSTAIFHRLCEQAQIAPEACVFIDDWLHNCIGAKAAGMDAIHFKGADRLRTELQLRGFL